MPFVPAARSRRVPRAPPVPYLAAYTHSTFIIHSIRFLDFSLINQGDRNATWVNSPRTLRSGCSLSPPQPLSRRPPPKVRAHPGPPFCLRRARNARPGASPRRAAALPLACASPQPCPRSPPPAALRHSHIPRLQPVDKLRDGFKRFRDEASRPPALPLARAPARPARSPARGGPLRRPAKTGGGEAAGQVQSPGCEPEPEGGAPRRAAPAAHVPRASP